MTVKAHHITVNRGELHQPRECRRLRRGWGFAGEVVATHDDGPRTGEFVAGLLLEGAWGQFTNGVTVTYGNSERTNIEFPTSAFYEREGRPLGYHLPNDVVDRPSRHDLRELFDLVARADITVEHRRPVSWTSTHDVLAALAARTVD